MHAPAHHPSLSDDAYAVLLDVARQPRSILLATTPQSATRELLDPPAALTPSATRLTSAERHLLAHHRDEVARWLQWTIARLLSERSDMAPMYSQQESGTWADVPRVRRLLAQGANLMELNQTEAGIALPRGLRALRRRNRDFAAIRDLVSVSASFRADPFHTLVNVTLWIAQGYRESAARACREVLSQPCTTEVAHAAHSRLGTLAALDRRWIDAGSAYARAFEFRGIECTALCALRNALQAGDQPAVMTWVQVLPSEGPDPRALEMIRAGVAHTVLAGTPSWTDDADRLARGLARAPWVEQWVCGGAA